MIFKCKHRYCAVSSHAFLAPFHACIVLYTIQLCSCFTNVGFIQYFSLGFSGRFISQYCFVIFSIVFVLHTSGLSSGIPSVPFSCHACSCFFMFSNVCTFVCIVCFITSGLCSCCSLATLSLRACIFFLVFIMRALLRYSRQSLSHSLNKRRSDAPRPEVERLV